MADETRETPMTTPCPHCGGELVAKLAGITPAEFQQPTSWVRTGQRCISNGCTFMAGDVAVDAP